MLQNELASGILPPLRHAAVTRGIQPDNFQIEINQLSHFKTLMPISHTCTRRVNPGGKSIPDYLKL